jgi:HEAT repeat protein
MASVCADGILVVAARGKHPMCEQQLDLFAATGISPERRPRPDSGPEELVAADLDDGALVAAIPWAGLADAPALVAEAGRRGLLAAVPALEQLCLRFAGFGLERAVPEQVAAIDALARIGGSKAADTVARLIARSVVHGPTRKVAVDVAARLRSALPVETVLDLLRDADPKVRADACRCAGPWPAVLQVLLDLADDVDSDVRVAAACALGRMGRREARPALGRLLRDAPSVEVIDAIPAIADEDCVILLGRIVRTRPGLAGAARDALEMIDHPRARQLVAAITAGRDE